MEDLDRAVTTVVERCLGVTEGEGVLVVADPGNAALGDALMRAARAAGGDAVLTILPPNPRRGTEPPPTVAAALAAADVFIAPCLPSLSHTTARKRASEGGTRGATMPGVTADLLARLMSADFDAMSARCHAVAGLLADADDAHLTCARGTDMRFDLRGRPAIADDGVLTARGAFGNLPCGEGFASPAGGEGTIAASSLLDSLPDEPVLLTVRDGRLDTAEGERRGGVPRAPRRARTARAQPRRARRRHERPRHAHRQHARGREDPRHDTRRVRRKRRDRRHGDRPRPRGRHRARPEPLDRLDAGARRWPLAALMSESTSPTTGERVQRAMDDHADTLLTIPNVSEGRDPAAIAAIGAAFASAGARLLDAHADPDHHRSVYTLAAPVGEIAQTLVAGARECVRWIDLREARGSHPHVGALDVAPVVYLDAARRGAACAEALVAGEELGREGLAVFLYGELAGGRTRAELRRGGVQALAERVAAGEHRPRLRPPRDRPAGRRGARRGATPARRLQHRARAARDARRRAGDRRADPRGRDGGTARRARARPDAARTGGTSHKSRRTSRTTTRVPLAKLVAAIALHADVAGLRARRPRAARGVRGLPRRRPGPQPAHDRGLARALTPARHARRRPWRGRKRRNP